MITTTRLESESVGVVRLGIGYELSSLGSEISNIGGSGDNDEFTIGSSTYGAILDLPIIDLVSMIQRHPMEISDEIRPVVDCTLAWAERNVGRSSLVASPFISEPIPRQAVLGLNIRLGLNNESHRRKWKIISFIWARQVEDVLTAIESFIIRLDGMPPIARSYGYKGGLGDIVPIENLILGRSNGKVDLGKGWQFQLAELLYVRGGGFNGVGGTSYSTYGAGLGLDGLMKFLDAFHVIDAEVPGAYSFILDHFDLQYDFSQYTGASISSAASARFESLNLVVR